MIPPRFMSLISACVATGGLFLILCGTAQAQDTVYKIVDENGRVTYSSTPPEGAQKATTLDVPPPPTAEQAQEAETRVQRLEEATDKAEKARREREQAEAVAKAQQQSSVYITPVPVVGNGQLPYSYPAYGGGYWYDPPFRHPDQRPDRPSRPGGGTRPRPTPRR
jgi:hypothetical protein